MIGEALALASLVGSAFGTGQSALANRRIDRRIGEQEKELQYWFDKEYNRNFFDTDQAKSVISTLRNQHKDTLRSVAGDSAVTGASNEAKIAATEKTQKGYSDALTKLAGYGTNLRDSLRREYITRKSGLENLQLANLQNKSQNWANFMNNAMNAGIGFAEASGAGAFNDWDTYLKGLFKKEVKTE